MADTILSTRIATTNQELTVNLMADELHARGADLTSKASVVNVLTGAGFRAANIELLCESAAITAWRHYRDEEAWQPWEDEREAVA